MVKNDICGKSVIGEIVDPLPKRMSVARFKRRLHPW
jgi:hypothetical protein